MASDLGLGFDLPDPVLVVVAHPDDVDFGIAGTVARLTDAGAEVVYCLVTDGEAGAPDDLPRHEVAALRRREQEAAAAEVGVKDVRFLGYPDGRLVADLDLRRAISRVIRQVRPQLVIGQSPDRLWQSVYASHPDHLAVGEATMAAVYPDARNRWSHTDLLDEGLEPHTVDRVWIAHTDADNRYVDITDVHDRKMAALRCHESQTAALDLDEILRGWATMTAEAGGLPPGRLAEGFRELVTT